MESTESEVPVVLLDSDDDDMNLVITDVISLAADLQDPDDTPTCKEGNPSQTSCKLEKDVENTESKFMQTSLTSPPSSSAIVATVGSTETHDTSLSTPVEVDNIKPLVEPIPNINKCLTRWKDIFPWVQYNEEGNTFTCSICQWGYNYNEYLEVYKVMNQKDIFCVAGKLRGHTKKIHHKVAGKEQEFLLKFSEDIYVLVKGEMFPHMWLADIGKSMPDILDSKAIMPLMLQNIAVSIESLHLESLLQSPFFSVVVFKSQNCIMVRWLTQDNEIVEHIFYKQIHTNKENLAIFPYLQFRGVDMSRIVSYSNTMDSPMPVPPSVKVVNVADRICPIETCIVCLSRSGALDEIFIHLHAVHKMCCKRDYFRSISRHIFFYEAVEKIANVPDSEVDHLLIEKSALNFLYSEAQLLDDIAEKVPDLENRDKLNFRLLSTKQFTPLHVAVYLLNQVKWNEDNSISLSTLKEIRTLLTAQMKRVEGITSDDYLAMSIIDMFISDAIVCKISQSNSGVRYVNNLVKKISNINYHEMEDIFRVFMNKLCDGKGFHQIQQLHAIFGKEKTNSPLTLMAILQGHPEYHTRFPELLSLGQMIMVLPVLNAHSERYPFDVTAAETYLQGKVEDDLLPYILYILLEGPDNIESLKKYILKCWCRTALP